MVYFSDQLKGINMMKPLAFCLLLLCSGSVMPYQFDALSQSNVAQPGVNNAD